MTEQEMAEERKNLGVAYLIGDPTIRNDKEAVSLWQMAAEKAMLKRNIIWALLIRRVVALLGTSKKLSNGIVWLLSKVFLLLNSI